MRAQEIVIRIGHADNVLVAPAYPDGEVRDLDVLAPDLTLKFGGGQILQQLAERGLRVPPVAVDLLVLALAVQAADTRLSRVRNAQDAWTREIALHVPVHDPRLWTGSAPLLSRMLRFLTGDLWTIRFRATAARFGIPDVANLRLHEYDEVALFSGGLDSFIGAVDRLHHAKNPMFVSHYWDLGTSSQAACVQLLANQFGANTDHRHIRANVGTRQIDFPTAQSENTQRGRSFLFFALATVAAGSLEKQVEIIVPENGLISLNVPLDPHRLGGYSTRTTHPFYIARWNDLVRALGIATTFVNPYRFKTKGEMLRDVSLKSFVERAVPSTISCSSVAKARWGGHAPTSHCGYCVPCLIRRSAERVGLGHEVTPYVGLPQLAGAQVRARTAIGEHIRSFQFINSRLDDQPRLSEMLVWKTGPLSDYSVADRALYSGVVERGLREVGTTIAGVQCT